MATPTPPNSPQHPGSPRSPQSPRPPRTPADQHVDGLVAASADAPNPYVRLEKWTWLLIFIGGFGLALGIATLDEDAAIGWSIVVPCVAAIVTGIVLIYVRSRLKDPKP
ncbi:hypothetical protein ACSFA3_01140 [Variovorax sp. RHLX14]|uniref:hypothetical protein n=1 Tax=Variovorax sp. RHLX14 TaxID=1259731 RepID=UPI003F45D60B